MSEEDKQRAVATNPEEVPDDAVDPQLPGPKDPIETKQKRKISRFQEIYSQIQTAKEAVQFIENFQKDFTDVKTGTLALFLQAFSGHSAAYYHEFYSDPLSKPHALFLLEKASETYGVQAKGGTYGTLAPFILEFVLRCEAGGMATGKAWMADVPGPMLGQENLPLTSAKDMLDQLSAKDQKSKAHRRVEIVTTQAELIAACKHMTTPETYLNVGCGDVTNTFTKLFSKCRKIVTTQNKPVKEINMFTSNVKKEGIRQKRNRDGEIETDEKSVESKEVIAAVVDGEADEQPVPAPVVVPALTPCPKEIVEVMVEMFQYAFVTKQVPPPTKFATFAEWMRRGEVSAEMEASLAKVETVVADLGDVEADQLELVMTLKSCGEDPKEFIKAMSVVCTQTLQDPPSESDEDAEPEAETDKEVHATAGLGGNNMFTALADLPVEDVAAKAPPSWVAKLTAPDPIVLDETLKLTSPDVLSALAVAANKVKGEEVEEPKVGDDEGEEEQEKKTQDDESEKKKEKEEGKGDEPEKEGLAKLTCKRRAIKLLEKVAASGITLPRRAMTLVMEERAKDRRKRQGPGQK